MDGDKDISIEDSQKDPATRHADDKQNEPESDVPRATEPMPTEKVSKELDESQTQAFKKDSVKPASDTLKKHDISDKQKMDSNVKKYTANQLADKVNPKESRD